MGNNKTSTTPSLPAHGDDLAAARRILEAALGIPFSAGNHITVLRNGDQIFPAMLAAIEQAETRIEFLTFIYWTGDVAQQFAHALAKKARAGVIVNVLLDSVGATFIDKELIPVMTEAGVNVCWFRPKARWKIWQLDHRTHRKVLVVDSRVGFTGGVGIAKQWEGDARNPEEWRDSHFRIEGPAVHALQAAFLGNWLETGQLVHPAVDAVPELPTPGDTWIQVVRATAAVGWSDIATLNETLIANATQRLRIASAYFVPDRRNIKLLIDAAERGVDIDIITPGKHHDRRVSQVAGEAEFEPLLAAGITIWAYQRAMFHCKVITVDGYLSCIGSPNFNQRSMRKDDEVVVVAVDPEFAQTLNDHFELDLDQCERIKPGRWRQRGPLQRLKETLIQPFKTEM